MNAKNIIAEYDVPSTGLWAALVFVVSLNLRPAIAAVGPLLTQIGADLSWGEGVQGVLTAIPLLAFAAVSPLVTFIERRVGVDIAILSALLCIAVGNFIRSYCGNVGIWLGTVIFASSIAVGNVLVPVIVKRDYAGHIAMATGVYSGCITVGAATAGLISAPLAQVWCDWRASLAVWSVPPLVVAALWALRILHNRQIMQTTVPNVTRTNAATTSHESGYDTFRCVLRRPMTWYVTVFMGLQSSTFYTMSNWIPSVSASAGFDASTAGVHLFIFQGGSRHAGVPASHDCLVAHRRLRTGISAGRGARVDRHAWAGRCRNRGAFGHRAIIRLSDSFAGTTGIRRIDAAYRRSSGFAWIVRVHGVPPMRCCRHRRKDPENALMKIHLMKSSGRNALIFIKPMEVL